MFLIRFFVFLILFAIVYAIIRMVFLVSKAKKYMNQSSSGYTRPGREKDVSKSAKILDEKWLDEDKKK